MFFQDKCNTCFKKGGGIPCLRNSGALSYFCYVQGLGEAQTVLVKIFK